jgi:Carboxypeptidase regulatory-like domain/TonB-dependent Receptor Plug Domain
MEEWLDSVACWRAQMRFPRSVRLYVFLALSTLHLLAQSPNGNINGLVSDPSSAAVVGAEVVAVNDVTGVQYTTKTNAEGIYVLPDLPPGPYRLQVSKIGFNTIIKPDIVLNVQDALSINFTLPIGAFHEIVTVKGGAPLVNTTDGSVSTVIDHDYVANMPLNGRSFQDLILLTPGVVTNTPQTASSVGESGEFSVNGQRTESNIYLVDGVAANTGIAPNDGGEVGPIGGVAAATAVGTTQALISVDALQEFRVQTSTYSAEYGRSPGGQFSFVTRSGTNVIHGTGFDYLRNNIFDANNWFNDYYAQPQSALRQNDFGGTLGGPLTVPALYNSANRTFFFVSYEGLRAVVPQPSTVNYVPDSILRQSVPPILQQVLNSYPQPTAGTPDLGGGMAEYIGTWSNPSSLDAYSVRFDHTLGNKLSLFFRFGDTPSRTSSRANSSNVGNPGTPSVVALFTTKARTYTLGATSLLSPRVSNEFRLNYSSYLAGSANTIDSFGGAQSVDLAGLQQLNSADPFQVVVGLYLFPYPAQLSQASYSALEKQWNLTDAVTLQLGRHRLKYGIDYRRLAPFFARGPQLYYFFFEEASVQSNNPDETLASTSLNGYPLYTNFSAFAQDEWKIGTRLDFSMGLRWDVNPAPSVTRGAYPYTVQGIDDLSTMLLAPQGTPLWRTTWWNLAPRLGMAYVARATPGYETVLRGGGGLFFDTGQQVGSSGLSGPGFSASTVGGSLFGEPTAFPAASPPVVTTPPIPPYTTTYAYPAHLQLPYTLEWNATVEQALAGSQTFSVAYVGSHAGRLLELSAIDAAAFNPNFTYLYLYRNGLTADYNSLQLQFKRRVTRGLTALAAYTWSHSIDYGSQNYDYQYFRGNSDFDVRQSFSAAFSYDLPGVHQSRVLDLVSRHWGLDGRFSARTSFPVTLQGNTTVDPATGQSYYGGLNLVAGQPLYTYGAQCAAVYGNGLPCPGGRAINPNAFSIPASGYGDAPRNFVRGFGAWQMNSAVRRDFFLTERFTLQFRAEAFNVFNHPNFGIVNSTFGTATFGQATATLNASLGTESSLYQMGGPRSMQFALKLTF